MRSYTSTLLKLAAITGCFLASILPAFCQSGYTAVQGVVEDKYGSVYANCTWTVQLLNQTNPPAQLTLNGFGLNQTLWSGNCDSSGNFSVPLYDNSQLAPPNQSEYQFNFCAKTIPPGQQYPPCFQLTLAVTGASENITSQIQAAAAILNPINPGVVTGNLLPSVDNSWSLGSASFRWANLYGVNATLSNPLSTSSGGTGTSSPGLTFGNPVGLLAPVTGFQDKGGQVFNVKAYGAKGDGVTDDTAAIQATINAMPSCTFGSSTWNHCGTLFLPIGTYAVNSIALTSPFVRIVGTGTQTSVIKFTGTTGCAIDWTANPFNAADNTTNSGGLFDVSIQGNSSANTCGVKAHDIVGFKMNTVSITGFTGSGSRALWDETDAGNWNERWDLRNVELSNSYICWSVEDNNTSGSGNTFGYGFFDLKINPEAGQTGIESKGSNSTYGVILAQSFLNVIINAGSGATIATFNNYSKWAGAGNVHWEGSGAIGPSTDSTSSFFINGYMDFGIPATGGNISALSANNSIAGVNLINPVAATSTANQSSPNLYFYGQYWNGSASATDQWWLVDGLESGTNPNSDFSFYHSGSSGLASVIFQQHIPIKFTASSGGGNLTLNGPATMSDFPTITFPDATGTVALRLAGQLTTTASTSDSLTITGLTASSICTFSAANASAASNIASSYISSITANTVTLTHTATSGMVYNFTCQ